MRPNPKGERMEAHDIRWLPRHGSPQNMFEWICQTAIRIVAFLPVYIAIVVTLILLIEIFGVPGM